MRTFNLWQGAMAARVQLCRAAIYYRTGRLEKALEALPNALIARRQMRHSAGRSAKY